MIYGYARAHADGQSLEVQMQELTGAGCETIFQEVASGAKQNRAQLRKLLDKLEPGDLVTVTRLEQLARSTLDLLSTLDAIIRAGAGFRSLRDVWADTTTAHGRPILTVLGGLAEFERELILSRTNEARAQAKARGVKLGRKPTLTAYQQSEALSRLAEGESVCAVARSMAVSHSTISRLKTSATVMAAEPSRPYAAGSAT